MTAREKKQTRQAPDAVPQASRREWIGLAVLALPALLISMDLSVLYLAVPRLSAALRPSSVQLLWITDIYGFLLAGSLITMGALGDRIGRRKLLMIGGTAFGLASVLAAFSTSAATLITARALMGIAAATLAPSSLALLSNMFKDPKQRTRAISVWATSLSAGGAVGPIVGGILLNSFWWGSVFLVAVPVMLLLVMTAPLLLPEYRNPQAVRLDLTSAALSLGTLLLVIYGLKQIAQSGLGWVPVLAIVAGALAALGRNLDRALIWRIHPRLPTDPAPGALYSPSFCDGCGPGSGVNWLRHPYPGRNRLRISHLRDWLGSPFAGDGASLHAGHQHGARLHSARASRRSLGDVGDKHRVGRSARHRHARKHWHCRLSQPGGPRHSSRNTGQRRQRDPRRCRGDSQPSPQLSQHDVARLCPRSFHERPPHRRWPQRRHRGRSGCLRHRSAPARPARGRDKRLALRRFRLLPCRERQGFLISHTIIAASGKMGGKMS
jgi:MFS family permease